MFFISKGLFCYDIVPLNVESTFSFYCNHVYIEVHLLVLVCSFRNTVCFRSQLCSHTVAVLWMRLASFSFQRELMVSNTSINRWMFDSYLFFWLETFQLDKTILQRWRIFFFTYLVIFNFLCLNRLSCHFMVYSVRDRKPVHWAYFFSFLQWDAPVPFTSRNLLTF